MLVSKKMTVTGPQSTKVSLDKIESMSQVRLIFTFLRVYVSVINRTGLVIVSYVVGQGSPRVITNVAEADFEPTVPVISNVYAPGL